MHDDARVDGRVGALAEVVHLVSRIEQRLGDAVSLALDAADVARARVGERYSHRALRTSISVAASGARGASG